MTIEETIAYALLDATLCPRCYDAHIGLEPLAYFK